MSVWISVGIVILLGLIIFLFKPKWFLLYYVTIEPLVLPVIAWYGRINTYEALNETKLKVLGTGSGTLLIIVLLIALSRNRRNLQLSGVYSSFALLVFFLLVFYLTYNFDISLLLTDVRQSLVPLMALTLMQVDRKLIPSAKSVLTVLIFFLIYEFIWCLLNLNGIHIYVCQYFENVTYRNAYGFNVDLVSGTFQRFSDLSDFLTTIFLFVCILFFYERRLSKKLFVFFSVMIISMVVISGSKVAIILIFFLLFFCSFSKWHEYKILNLSILIILGAIVSLFTLFNFVNLSLPEISGLNRITYQLSNIFYSFDKADSGTLTLSFYLLDNYFYRDPLFGNGLATYGGSGAYGMTTFFKTDSRIAFILVEYGLLGFAAFMSYYFNLFKTVLQRTGHYRTMILSFTYFFLLTITQPGFFGYIPLFLFILLSHVFSNKNDAIIPCKKKLCKYYDKAIMHESTL